MFKTLIDKTLNLIDRSFIFGWWIPTLFTGCFLLLLVSIINQPCSDTEALLQNITRQGEVLLNEYSEESRSTLSQLIGFTLLITFIAVILYILHYQIIQFYEGYWPIRVKRWYVKNMFLNISMKCTSQKFDWILLEKDKHANDIAIYSALEQRLFYEYPPEKESLLPTKLGNAVRAAETYSYTRYGMDGVFWWPRLWRVLPENFQKEIDNSLLSMIALLNSTTLLILGYLATLLFNNGNAWDLLSISPLIILISYIIYLCAVSQAINYGILIRCAVDLYRFDLLKKMRITLPENSETEKKLWEDSFKYMYKRWGKIEYVENESQNMNEENAEDNCDANKRVDSQDYHNP